MPSDTPSPAPPAHPPTPEAPGPVTGRPGRPALVVVGCAAALFWPGVLAFGFPGLMAADWQALFEVGRGAIGAVLFFSLAGLGVANLFSSRLPAGFSPLQRMLAGTLLMSGGIFLVAFADRLWQVYLWAFLTGLASILIYVPAVMLPQLAVPRYRGLATGLVSALFGLSAALATPILGRMLASLGYVPMTLIVLALTLVTGGAGVALIRCSLPARRGAAETGTSPPVASAQESPEAPIIRARLGAEVKRVLPSSAVSRALRSRSFWALWLTWALQGGAGIAMVTLAVGLGVSKGFSTSTSLAILSAFNLANGLSRLMAGAISDRLGRQLTMTVASVPAGLAYIALPHADSLGATALLAALVGLGFGSMFAVSAPLVGECFGLRHFAPIFSLVMTAYGFVGSLLGPALSGYALDLSEGDYVLVLGYLGVCCLVAAVLVQFVRPVIEGEVGRLIAQDLAGPQLAGEK